VLSFNSGKYYCTWKIILSEKGQSVSFTIFHDIMFGWDVDFIFMQNIEFVINLICDNYNSIL